MLKYEEISRFHRLKSDEIWFFHKGSSIKIHTISDSGNYEVFLLGSKIHKGENFQAIITAGTWFAAENINKNNYSLVSCTVAPGFDFDDFELADQNELISLFPVNEKIIRKFT